MVLPRTARPGCEVVLEVRIAARGVLDALERKRGEGRTAQVRVDDHAGRVQDAAQTGPQARLGLGLDSRDKVAGLVPAASSSRARSIAARVAASARDASVTLGERAHGVLAEQCVDGRKLAQRPGFHAADDRPLPLQRRALPG